MNGPWFDKFYAMHPNIPIGCSKYGCEALNWHMLRLMGKLFGGKKKVAGFEMTPDMMTMMNGFTVLRLLTMAGGMMNVKSAKEDLLKLNARLNRVKQPGKK